MIWPCGLEPKSAFRVMGKTVLRNNDHFSLMFLLIFCFLKTRLIFKSLVSPLELVEVVGLLVPLHMGISGDRGPASWSFIFGLPTRCHSPFSFSDTAQVPGSGFSINGGREMDPTEVFTTPIQFARMLIKSETEIIDSAKGALGSTGARTQETWIGRGEVSSLFTLPACWFTAGQNDQHFLALFIQTAGDGSEGFTI